MTKKTEELIMNYAWDKEVFTVKQLRADKNLGRGVAYLGLAELVDLGYLRLHDTEVNKKIYFYQPNITREEYAEINKPKPVSKVEDTLGKYIKENKGRYLVIENRGEHKLAIYGYYTEIEPVTKLYRSKIKRIYTDSKGQKVILI